MSLSGRGQKSHAYIHSVQFAHHVFLNLHTLKFYCLPDNYEIIDSSLEDITVSTVHFWRGWVSVHYCCFVSLQWKVLMMWCRTALLEDLHLWFASAWFLCSSMCWSPRSPNSISLVWISMGSCTEPTMARPIFQELWVWIISRPMTTLMWFCR